MPEDPSLHQTTAQGLRIFLTKRKSKQRENNYAGSFCVWFALVPEDPSLHQTTAQGLRIFLIKRKSKQREKNYAGSFGAWFTLVPVKAVTAIRQRRRRLLRIYFLRRYNYIQNSRPDSHKRKLSGLLFYIFGFSVQGIRTYSSLLQEF